MKVITYNLHKGVSRSKQSMLAEAVHALNDRRPDLLLCQEVFHGAAQAIHQCHFITEVIGHPHVFAPNAFYAQGCHGNATFARMRMARHVNVDMTESFLERRGMLRTWFEGEQGPFEVLNVHFSLTAGQRRRQWSKLVQALPEDPHTPLLACGDFNDWSGALDRRAQRSNLLRNVLWDLERRDRPTFPSHRPVFPLDRIYYRGFVVEEVRVLKGLPWSELSDHLPVEAILRAARADGV